MAMRFLARATFRDPVMKLVAVEKVVCAEHDGRCSVILKVEEGRAVTGSKTVSIQCAHARADAAHGASEQPHHLDLVGDLIERDAAARLAVKFIGAMRAQEEVVVVEGKDHPEPAQLAALNDPVHFADVWIEGVRMANDQMQAGTICRRNDLIAFLKRQSQRLLDQNVLALLHRLNRLTRVKAMRRRDVDGLD